VTNYLNRIYTNDNWSQQKKNNVTSVRRKRNFDYSIDVYNAR